MRVIARTVWQEPAAAIGLLTSVALIALAVLSGASWDASTIAGILAPLLSGLGIRQLVSPAPPAQETTDERGPAEA
jgi:hypothetical protein